MLHQVHQAVTKPVQHHRTYFVTSQQHDPQEGRRKAYQKWSKTPINWDQQINYQALQMHQSQNHAIHDKMAYYKQFGRK